MKNPTRRIILKHVGNTALLLTGAAFGVMDFSAHVQAQENGSFLSADEIMRKHAEAIKIGREEYVENLLQSENYATGRYKDKPSDWKRERAIRSFNSRWDTFIEPRDNNSMNKLAIYAPSFTGYILRFKEDFVFAVELQKEANIAESKANIADSLERQKAFKRLIELLAEHSS